MSAHTVHQPGPAQPGPRLPDVSTLFPWQAWFRDRTLRSWTTWLFVALVAMPPLAYALFHSSSGWVGEATAFAFYFAAAWFLVLWVVVRPQRIGGSMLAQIAGMALVIEAPLAIALETALDASTDNVLASIVTIGVPEELAKMVPVALLLVWRRRRAEPLPPREVLFLGAVSGLVFGAVEAVEYVTDPTASGTGAALVAVWRLLTDPISHACWAGVAGYFLGLAAYYRELGPWFALGGIGLGVPAVLHGINDVVAGDALWVIIAVVSTLLFLAYARVGIAARPAPPAHATAADPPAAAHPTQPALAPRVSAPRHPATASSPRTFVDPPTAPIILPVTDAPTSSRAPQATARSAAHALRR